MAVLSVTEEFDGSSSGQQLDGLRVFGQAVRIFKVMFGPNDTVADKQIAALSASFGGVRIPSIFDAHPADANWYCISRTARPQTSGVHWMVEVNYQYMENPLARVAEIEWDTAEEPAIVESDINGDAVCASSGEMFDPPPQEMVCDIVGRINYAASQFDGLIAADYTDSVNNATMRIDSAYFPAYTVKINKWKGKKLYWGNTPYWDVYLEIQIRLTYKPGTSDLYGWRKQIIDQGFYRAGTFDDAVAGGHIVGKVPIRNRDLATYTDSDGINADDQVTSPVLLDGDGGILATGATPVLLYFETKKKRNFGIFNLRW
jgi:hypothetical protein